MQGQRIIDTSALLLWPREQLAGCVVAVSQRAELAKLSAERSLLVESVDLVWCSPSSAAGEAARSAAAASGDLPRLSPVDLDLIALALDDERSVLYTDDYRIQNTLSLANREWKAVAQRGITAEWTWVLRCSGCGLESPAGENKAGVCTHCGSPQRLKRRRM